MRKQICTECHDAGHSVKCSDCTIALFSKKRKTCHDDSFNFGADQKKGIAPVTIEGNNHYLSILLVINIHLYYLYIYLLYHNCESATTILMPATDDRTPANIKINNIESIERGPKDFIEATVAYETNTFEAPVTIEGNNHYLSILLVINIHLYYLYIYLLYHNCESATTILMPATDDRTPTDFKLELIKEFIEEVCIPVGSEASDMMESRYPDYAYDGEFMIVRKTGGPLSRAQIYYKADNPNILIIVWMPSPDCYFLEIQHTTYDVYQR
jgi:hypothetical protein